MHSLRTPFSQICLPSARISSCASARHCQIILRPESCKYGLPFPDAWTFALRKSAIGELNRCLRGHPQLGEAQRSCWTVGHIVWLFGFILSKRLDSRWHSGRWGHLQVVATLQHEPSTKLELKMQKETVFPKQWNALRCLVSACSSGSSQLQLQTCEDWSCVHHSLLSEPVIFCNIYLFYPIAADITSQLFKPSVNTHAVCSLSNYHADQFSAWI